MWPSTPEIYAEIFLPRDLKNSDAQHHWDHSAALVQTVQCLLPEHQRSPRIPGIGPDSTARNKGRIKMQRQPQHSEFGTSEENSWSQHQEETVFLQQETNSLTLWSWLAAQLVGSQLLTLLIWHWCHWIYLFQGESERKEEYHQCNMGKYFRERTQVITSSVNWSLASILLPKNKYMCVSLRSTSCSSEGTSQRCTIGAQFWKAIYTDQESAINSVQPHTALFFMFVDFRDRSFNLLCIHQT